jgi:hypothetical protein
MKRYLVGLAALALLEMLMFMVPLFGRHPFVMLGASVPATAAVLGILYGLWPRVKAPGARLVASLAGGWVMMLFTAVLLAAFADDPLASQRIAARGWVTYFFVDKVLRGLLSGLLWGTVAYVWVWVPIGYVTMIVMKRVRPGAPAATATARRP